MYGYLTIDQANFLKSVLSQRGITQVKNKMVSDALKLANSIGKSTKNNIKDISSVLEYDFSDQAKKDWGITFTPNNLVKFMYADVLQLSSSISNIKIADLALGNGIFFSELLFLIKEKKSSFKLVPFIENNLYGYDIKKENIYLAKLILSTICVFYGEDTAQIEFKLFEADSLSLLPEYSFDLIVGNPPYVKQQNINKDYRNFLKTNFNVISSNYNLYYAFIEQAIRLLKSDGKILFLLPNYLLKIKSAEILRKRLLDKKMFSRIVDFKSTQMFSNIGTYSMVLELQENSEYTEYKVLNDNEKLLDELRKKAWINKKINSYETINLTSDGEDKLINAVQGQLYELDISTGIATQKDMLYLIDKKAYVNDLNRFKYYKIYKDKVYEIESKLVMKIIKGSRNSSGANEERFIIYPYTLNNGQANLIDSCTLKKKYPMCYKYFIAAEQELISRSGVERGNDWYKYGRSQALNRVDPKIIFPTNTVKPQFHYVNEKALFYNGYAIYGLKNQLSSELDMQCIEIILNSKLIERFMKITSYYIGGGYVSYQKKYLSKVTIPVLNSNQKKKLVELKSKKDEADKMVEKLYGLS